jgi:hypothetical protein
MFYSSNSRATSAWSSTLSANTNFHSASSNTLSPLTSNTTDQSHWRSQWAITSSHVHRVAWEISDQRSTAKRRLSRSTNNRWGFFHKLWRLLLKICDFKVGREPRKDTGIIWMSSTLDTTSCRTAKEDEWHLLRWKVDFGSAADPHSATVDGQRSGHA